MPIFLDDASPSTAPLSRAFQRLPLTDVHPPHVKLLAPAREPGGLSGNSPSPFPKGTGHGAPSTIRTREDSICRGRLQSLGSAKRTYEYTHRSNLLDLCGFVMGLNATRPHGFHFNTIIINDDMYNVLFETSHGICLPPWGCVSHGICRPRQNMITMGGITFLYHHGIPLDCAYVLSSEQAPIFVYGPSTTVFTGSGRKVTRQCGFVEPPPGMLEFPWGIRLGVRKLCDTDDT